MPLMRVCHCFNCYLYLPTSFDKQHISRGETAASPKGGISIHLFEVFLSWKMFVRIERRGQQPLTLGFEEDLYDTCIKGMIVLSKTPS
jgi:hypothetical protein